MGVARPLPGGSEVVVVDDGLERDDASLVLAAQAGDQEAFTLLFRRHYGSVRRVCARRLANGGEADEMAQAAFVRAYERISQCEGDRRFGAWVQVIALRLCGDAWRAASRVTPVAEPVPADSASAAAASSDVCVDALLRRERAAAVRGALATLPARQREVIVARYVEGRRPRDVAASLAVSVGAVDSLLLRARRKLALACQASGVEHGAASASVTTTSLVAGSAAAEARPFLRPLARLAEWVGGALDAMGAGVSGALGLGPATPTVAQRAAGLVGAGALLLAPLAATDTPAAPAPVVQRAAAAATGASAVEGALDLPGMLAGALAPPPLPPLTLPPVTTPSLTAPAVPAVALPPVPGLASGAPPAPLSGVTAPAGAAAGPLAPVLEAPAAAVAQVASTVATAAGDVSALVSSTLDQVAAAIGGLLTGAPPAAPAAPAAP